MFTSFCFEIYNYSQTRNYVGILTIFNSLVIFTIEIIYLGSSKITYTMFNPLFLEATYEIFRSFLYDL